MVAGTPVFSEGDGEETLVMLHGWPDTHRIWDKQVAHFRAGYRCVRFDLPGFAAANSGKGYSLDDVIASIRRVVDAVSPDKKVTLMLHDWGCIYGYEFSMRYPERVARVIAIDIGDANSPALEKSLSIAAKGMLFTYQMSLALAWQAGGRIGDKITQSLAWALRAKAAPADVHAGMNYPYATRWLRKFGTFDALQQVQLACPVFYAYGRKKPFMFHSPAWLQALDSRPHSQSMGFASAHWVMVDCSADFNAAVSRWLAGKNPAA